MRPVCRFAATLFIAVALAGCQKTDSGPVELPPPEVFNWTGDQPISFSPPPEEWKRSRYQNGGAEGVDFVLAGSKGEMIFVAERFFLGKRDRCARIEELLRDLDNHGRRSFDRALQRARLYAGEPISADEERMVEVVNYTLERARDAYRAGNRINAREELGRALEQAGRIRFTIDETVDRVLFTAEANSVYPALRVDPSTEGKMGGEPAVVVKFSFNGHGVPMVGLRIYAVKNNRLFEAGYQGTPENLPRFDAVVDSITFPEGNCEH